VATSLAAHIAPSAWFAGLLVSISRGDIAGAVAASASIVAAIALLYFVCVALGGSLISAAGVSEDTGSDQPRTGGGRRLPLFSSPVAAIVAKDALHVMRDSVLLSQLGMPLVLYLVPFLVAMNTSMAQSRDELLPVAMMMTGIIVFMQTSILALSSVGIESRAFWIPMLGPVSAASVLRAKFWLSLLVSGTIVAALTVVTGIIFRLPTSAVAITCLASVVLASGLCGLGVGLSGALPRFIYENPAHRVSAWALILGFVLTVAYLMIVAILFGGASLLAIRAELGFSPLMLYGTATVASLLITVLAIAVPMSIGSARLARYEWQH
jgi:hypothetical protein